MTSRPFRNRLAAMATMAAIAVLDGCFGGATVVTTPTGKAGETSSSAARPIKVVTLDGVAQVPRIISDAGAGLISDHGAGLVSNNSGSMISNNSGSLVSDAGAGVIGKTKRQLLAAGDADLVPVVGAKVRAFDAKGKPVAAEATTDKAGKFSIRGIPLGANVVVRITAPKFELASLARPFADGRNVVIDHATTLITAHLVAILADKPEDLAQVPIDKFDQLADIVLAAMRQEDIPVDLKSAGAAKDTYDQFSAKRADVSQGSANLVTGAAAAVVAGAATGKTGGTDEVAPSPRAAGGFASVAPGGEETPAPATSEVPGASAAPLASANPFPSADPTVLPSVLPSAPGPAPSVPNVESFAGSTVGSADGARASALFNGPRAVLRDPMGNLFVSDTANHTLRKIDAAGNVTTAGQPGVPGYANFGAGVWKLNQPMGLAYEPQTQSIFIAEPGNHIIRLYTEAIGAPTVTRAAGPNAPTVQAGFVDGNQPTSRFDTPVAIAIRVPGEGYVADAGNHAIRRALYTLPNTVDITTLCGAPARTAIVDGNAATAGFGTLTDLVCDAAGDLWVADTFKLRKVTMAGQVTTINLTVTGGGTCNIANLAIDAPGGGLLATTSDDKVFRITGTTATRVVGGSAGFQDGVFANALFSHPQGLFLDGAFLYVADQNNNRVRRINF